MPVQVSQPSPEFQIGFLADTQRLFEAGSFVATYKYALLLALADLSVELGNDSGEPLHLPLDAIAEKFVEYYWDQCRDFIPPDTDKACVLRQNTGKQAAVIRAVLQIRQRGDGRIATLRKSPQQWRELIAEVGKTVQAMPLWKLQVIGPNQESFLYKNELTQSGILLKPGVAFCFRRYRALIGDLIRGAWVRYIRRFNGEALGDAMDLHDFLFGSQRQGLRAVAPVLFEAQEGRCLYTQSKLAAPEDGEVDHFIPFSRYAHDSGFNLVLASKGANGQKSDHLAAEQHLERWIRRNREHTRLLEQGFESVRIPANLSQTERIARWIYTQHAESQTPAWLSGRLADVPLAGQWAEWLD